MRWVLLCLVLLSCGGSGVLAGGANELGPAGQPRDMRRFVIDVSGEITASRLKRAARLQLQRARQDDGGPADLADAAYAMEQMLREAGYPDAAVTFSMYEATRAGKKRVRRAEDWDRVDRVEFLVQPGDKVYVGRISFTGVSVFSEERLRGFFPEPDAGTPYRRQDFSEATGKVSRLYELRGYVSVHVDEMVISSRDDGGSLYYDVEIPIEEGARYTIAAVRIQSSGLNEQQIAGLRAELQMDGLAYYPRRAAQGAIRVRNSLGRQGYRAEVEYEVELTGGQANVTYTVRPGPVLVVDHVEIVPGEQERLRTRRGFIRSRIPLGAGDPLDQDLIREAEDNLYALGLFSFVEIRTEPAHGAGEPDAESGRDGVPTVVQFSLTEVRSRQLELSAGWGSYELAKGSLSFSDRNIFGIGRLWTTRLYGSLKTYGIETSLSDNVLLGPASTLSLRLAYGFRDAPAYDLTTIETGADAVIRLSSRWRIESEYTFALDRVREAVQEEEIATKTRYRASRLRGGVVRDGRNSIVLPTAGARVGVRASFSSPYIGSQLNYIGSELYGDYHKSVGSRVVVSVVGDTRSRYPLGGDVLPIQERLFLGGAGSVRSYGLDLLGPVGQSGEVIGGLTAVAGTTEIRVQIFDSLYVAGFYDIGVVSLDSYSLEGTLGQAVGMGARYYLPVGPIRLDLAYNPGELHGADGRWALHFAVGFGY